MSPWTLWRAVEDYLMQLPGAVKEAQLPDGSTGRQSVYTPHSLRATTATLLLDAGVDIINNSENGSSGIPARFPSCAGITGHGVGDQWNVMERTLTFHCYSNPLPSSATPCAESRNGVDREISNMFG